MTISAVADATACFTVTSKTDLSFEDAAELLHGASEVFTLGAVIVAMAPGGLLVMNQTDSAGSALFGLAPCS